MEKTNQDLKRRISVIKQKKRLFKEVDSELTYLKSSLKEELSKTKNKIILEKK